MSRRVTSSGFSPCAIRTTPPATSLPSFSSTPRRIARRDRRPWRPRQGGSCRPARPHRGTFSRSGRPAASRSESSPARPDAPSQPTPRTTYSAFALVTTCPPAAEFDAATASTTSLSVIPSAWSRRGSTATWYSMGNPPTLETSATPATEPSCGRTYQSWMARSRPRSRPAPSTVYQKIWPVARRIGRQRAARRPAGSSAPDPGQPLRHPPARLVERDAVVEDHADHREADVARRADHAHPAQPLQAQRQRIGHLVLDLARAVPLPVGEDDDLVLRQVGNRVHRSEPRGPDAEDGQDDAGADHQHAVADREGDDRVDHGPGVRPAGRQGSLLGSDSIAPVQPLAAEEDDPAGDDHANRCSHRAQGLLVTGQIFCRSASARSSGRKLSQRRSRVVATGHRGIWSARERSVPGRAPK